MRPAVAVVAIIFGLPCSHWKRGRALDDLDGCVKRGSMPVAVRGLGTRSARRSPSICGVVL